MIRGLCQVHRTDFDPGLLTSAMQSSTSFFSKIVEDNEIVVRHAIGMVITIACIWAFHFVLELTLGADAKLFDYVPIAYVAHIGDALAFLRFFWKMLREF